MFDARLLLRHITRVMQSSQYIDNYYVRTLREDTRYPLLENAVEADVCVIGGGLAGLNTMLGLIERGKNAVLVEARRIGWGASGRNAGFVAKGYSAGEGSLAGKVGLEHARRLVTMTKNARKLIRQRIADYDIDCGPVIDGVLTAWWKDNAEATKRYVEEANENFDLGFEFWPRDKVRAHCKTEKYYDGVYSVHDYQFNSLRYLRGIAGAITGRGGHIYEDTPALEISRDGGYWRVRTPQGSVRAQHVVLCCATYVNGLDKRIARASFPVRTYLMSTAPIDPEALKGAINTLHAVSDTRFCGDFYRRLPGNRLLWGGRVSLWASPWNIASAMKHDVEHIYPQLKGHITPETAWSGELCYAPHKMPQIGQIEPGYWYNTGFGGHGLCPTTACGEVVAAAIAQGDDAYREFAPFGLSYAGGRLGCYAAQMVYLWWRMRDVLGW